VPLAAIEAPPPIPEFSAFQHPKKRAFLVAYAASGTINRAAIAADINRGSHLVWLRDDDAYATAFAQAKEIAADRLEDEARRRAVEGELEPVYQGGRLVGWKRVKDTTLLIFLLKGMRPEKYREHFEHSGPGGGPIPITSVKFGGRYAPPPPAEGV
jgi:hypothetical protein